MTKVKFNKTMGKIRIKKSELVKKITEAVIREFLEQDIRSKSLRKKYVIEAPSSDMVQKAKRVVEKINQEYVGKFKDENFGTLNKCYLQGSKVALVFNLMDKKKHYTFDVGYNFSKDLLTIDTDDDYMGMQIYNMSSSFEDFIYGIIQEINPYTKYGK